ncbi:MAG: hypothetical protein WCK35_16815 [Chloroflexota bacterium]
MPRNRHARKNPSLTVPKPVSGQKDSPARPQPGLNPFTGQDVETLLVQLLVNSANLAFEPELLDLEFDPQTALEVTDHYLSKNKKRLTDAQLKGSQAFEKISEELHIKIVDELTTPDFRKDLQKRLHALRERFELEKELEKLKMVLALQPAIQSKEFPLSMTGLLGQIYSRTIQKSVQVFREEKQLLEDMQSEFNIVDASPQDIVDLLGNPDKLKPLEAKLTKNPGLMQQLEKQVFDMLDDFEKKLEQGQVELELFTREEIYLPFNRLEEILGPDAQKFDGSTAAGQKQIFDVLIGTMDELFTPQRWEKFYNDVEQTARKWMRARHPWGAALHAELSFLDKKEYEKSRFILSVYWGQIKRLQAPENSKPSKKTTTRKR